jgi:hypothetical protein
MVDFIHVMEVLFNAMWLLVAIGAFLFWRPERFRHCSAERADSRFLGILALACALVLLFPVISLTDDLHAEQAPMEDSSRSIIKARNMVQGCLRASRSPIVATIATAPYSADALHVFFGSVLMIRTRVLCLTLTCPHEGRSPPPNV